MKITLKQVIAGVRLASDQPGEHRLVYPFLEALISLSKEALPLKDRFDVGKVINTSRDIIQAFEQHRNSLYSHHCCTRGELLATRAATLKLRLATTPDGDPHRLRDSEALRRIEAELVQATDLDSRVLKTEGAIEIYNALEKEMVEQFDLPIDQPITLPSSCTLSGEQMAYLAGLIEL